MNEAQIRVPGDARREVHLIPTSAGWSAHPDVVAYVEWELENELWLAEAGFPTNEERPSLMLGLYVVSWLAAFGNWICTASLSRWSRRREAIPRAFFWDQP
ncbi:MAG: hypothetical protein QOF51_2439 [Chloroflexota bacterium]|jgi:hypothetical protein|nr:hypothetical protein [Chloroflexota bacterium]